ncbi:hypothetical protein M0R45_008801 [Rubus argutus]|uniref:Serine/threonine-protein kinase ATM n=1 Tax=Rubus argutus TaxID=59490 RepID=A0AAW1Y5K1_RUBAR
MVKSRDVQEIVAKLSSDKAKTRESLLYDQDFDVFIGRDKLLNTWLEGERSNDFCKYLGQNTKKLKPDEIPHSETWPFFITMLIQIVVQRAGDDKISGTPLPLLHVVKSLFNHIWEVLSNDPSFQWQSEYGLVLHDLLVVRDYRFHMRKRIYCSLVLLYMDNVENSLSGMALLRVFVTIFSYIRNEGKVSRKLIECINTFLLKDGPNLGCQSLEIHNAVHQFVFRCWLTTHDQAFKDALIFYARLQLNMTRGATDGSFLVQQLLDIVYKELDQSCVSNTNVPRTDAAKYEKFGTLSSSHCGLVELAAAVLYRACINLAKAPSTEKRVKREHVAAHLREALMKGKWLWNASFCCLTRKYFTRIGKDLFIYWFEGICTSFQRILNDANMGHSYDGLLWTLRSLQELSSVLLLPDPKLRKPSSSSPLDEVGIGDPHCVVFHLPEKSNNIHVCQPINHGSSTGGTFPIDTGLSNELLVALLKLLKKYLMDDSVQIVDMTSQALRGILSTQRGQSTLLSFDFYERSLIERNYAHLCVVVHSKGVNIELVEKLLFDLEIKFKAEAIPLEKSTVWATHGKTFDTWICPLVYSLIGLCSDVILRLCQDIVLMKAEVAELLLASIIVNLAGKKDMDVDLYKLISLQCAGNIFTDSNKLIKSIQVWLNALNELRLCHVMERSSLLPLKPESSKGAKPSTYSSKSRSTSVKARDSAAIFSAMTLSTPLWDKVYWLSIDYLVVAKSAIVCGSYFTAVMYVEHWCEEHFNSLTLGSPDFSHVETLPCHIEILVAAGTQINEPDSLYGIIQSHKLTSQIITFEHEGNWSKALEYYDLQRKPYKGLIRSLQQTGCMHVLDFYCQGLTSRKGQFHHDLEFTELQYEAAWRGANWDFSLLYAGDDSMSSTLHVKANHFNENLHSCLRALKEGDFNEFHRKLKDSKQELVWSVSRASEESTEHIYSAIIKLQILYHLGMAWDLRWRSFPCESMNLYPQMEELSWLNVDWSSILERTQLHMSLLEPFIAFRRVLLQVLSCKDSMVQHLLQSTSTLRKGSRFSQAAAALHEFKYLCVESGEQDSSLYWLGRLEEAKLLRSQGQHEMAISLAKYVAEYSLSNEESSDVHRLVGKWLAETRSSNSRTILEKYLKPAVSFVEDQEATDKRSRDSQSQTHFHLAHYADALFRSYEERLTSSEWQAAMRLRKHKTKELEALIRRLKCSTKGEKTDYSIKIQELQKQLAMDKEEAEKIQDDRDNFLSLALDGYKRCLVVGDKYDVRVVFRLVSLWFSLSARKSVVDSMLTTIRVIELNAVVQSYKFIPLVYQIASRMGSLKDSQGSHTFQFALVSLVKKMAIDHPYHTIFQLLALANGDRIKDKQRSKNSFVVDMDKKLAAENLLQELTTYHGAIIHQMKQMVEIYIKLAELETKREDTNRKLLLPRELRNLKQLELVPVVTATFPVDQSCQYDEGSFPYFKGLEESVMVMNGINAPKVIECLGSDGRRHKQLAKSGNDDLRQDAVMEQFFALVNTFLRNHRDTWKRRLGVRTYKVVPFTPSAGVLEWVNGTLPLGEYLIGSMRNGGAHGRYGVGDWSFLKCREHMANGKDKRKAFQEVCGKFRSVMHHFFLERFLQPADWFEKRLAYTRSVAASSMVGYIVGLGDRHAMNILIDQTTAEVVHIDLGVAFEQGLMLKTPERVPFRLTRDIIDGMGVTGVEGVFRRCCEETLSVMRTNKEALLTIVEVFIHDPLYKWALSPLKALQRQKTSLEDSQDEYEGNKDAARALMRVKQKLDGYEEGEMRSIHGQVQQLIQDAIDPERLVNYFQDGEPGCDETLHRSPKIIQSCTVGF